MLPLPNLDDRDFEQIVSQARKAIPKWLPEWTDENAHDPGITMIELFSWIAEMQQYYINRIPVRNQLKFLKLLGLRLEKEQSATVDVQFGNVQYPFLLPRGTKLSAQDQVYETVEAIRLSVAKLARIVVRTDREANDYTSTNDNAGVSFYAFGEQIRAGNRLYIALDREVAQGDTLTMAVKLNEQAGQRISAADKALVVPSANISWKYYGSPDGMGASSWLPLEVLSDSTVQLSYSGKLELRFPGHMRMLMIHPANDVGRYWICCTVEEEGYESPPRIEQLMLNAVRAEQQDKQSEAYMYDSTGEPGQSISLQSYLACYGEVKVQVLNSQGRWQYWRETLNLEEAGPEEPCYALVIDEAQSTAIIQFGNGVNGKLPDAGRGNIRLIAHTPQFRFTRFVGRSNGLPGQVIPVYDIALQSERFCLQAGLPNNGQLEWSDWVQVDNFDASGPADRHFVYDPDTGELRFGNNEQGAIPPAHTEPNLCLIACSFTGGERGNVKPQMINAFVDGRQQDLGLKVSNPFFATGGTERESLDDCIARAQRLLEEPFRAVTAQDVEQLAMATPGLRVARAKAIPMYVPGMKGYPKEKALGQLTVAVVPYSDAQTPMPSKGFIETIKRHLDERRLITTKVHIIPPEYICVTVHATVVVEPYFVDEAKRVVQAIRKAISPIGVNDGGSGWEFGRTVYRGDLLGIISALKGVSYIQELHLEAEGRNWRKTASGDIELPPYGLIYSGNHEIELVSRTDVQ